MTEEKSLAGWHPVLKDNLTVSTVIDLAFDYRGNVTIVKHDGTIIEGFISNRNSTVPEPYIEYFDKSGEGPSTVPYSQILNIQFTGKDTAAGQSWEAWMKRKETANAKLSKVASETSNT